MGAGSPSARSSGWACWPARPRPTRPGPGTSAPRSPPSRRARRASTPRWSAATASSTSASTPAPQVVVIGYQDEPYLRVGADGTVQVNDRSPARWLNEKRLADVPVPPSADPTAPPAWRTIGHGGERLLARPPHALDGHRPSPTRPCGTGRCRCGSTTAPSPSRAATRYVTPPPIWLVVGASPRPSPCSPRSVAWSRVALAGAVVGPTGVLAVVVGWALWRVPGGNSAGATAMVLGAIAVAGAVAGWWGRRGTYAGAFVAASGAALLACTSAPDQRLRARGPHHRSCPRRSIG